MSNACEHTKPARSLAGERRRFLGCSGCHGWPLRCMTIPNFFAPDGRQRQSKRLRERSQASQPAGGRKHRPSHLACFAVTATGGRDPDRPCSEGRWPASAVSHRGGALSQISLAAQPSLVFLCLTRASRSFVEIGVASRANFECPLASGVQETVWYQESINGCRLSCPLVIEILSYTSSSSVFSASHVIVSTTVCASFNHTVSRQSGFQERNPSRTD